MNSFLLYSAFCNLHNLSPEPNCGEKLSCVARGGKWKGQKICVEEEFLCDNTLQCLGGEDEDECETEYFKKKIFKPSELFVCKRTFKYLTVVSNVDDTLELSTTATATSSTSAPTTVSVDYEYSYFDDYEYTDEDIFGGKRKRRRKRDTQPLKEGGEKRKKFFPFRAVECDGAKQCPDGEDEEHCDIDGLALIFLGKHNFLYLEAWCTSYLNSRCCLWCPCLCHFCLLLPPGSHLWKRRPTGNE